MPTVIDIPKVGQVEFPDTMSDDEINVAAGELYDRADKGERLRQEAQEQLKQTEYWQERVKLYGRMERSDNLIRKGLGYFGKLFEQVNQNFKEIQAPVAEGLQRGGEVITGQPKRPYESYSTQSIAQQMMLEPKEDDPAWASIGKAGVNTLLGAAGAITSPAGVASAPVVFNPMMLAGVQAGMVGEALLAGERSFQALEQGDVYGAASGGFETLLFSAGANGVFRRGSVAAKDMPQSIKTATEAGAKLAKEAELKPKPAAKEVAQGELKVGADASKPKDAINEGQVQKQGQAEGAVDVKSGIKDVDARWDAAHGIGKKSLWTSTKEKLTSAKENFQRHFIDLDPKTDGAVINTLRIAEEIPIYSKFTAARNMSSIIGKLDKAKMDVFERAVILPDLVKDVEAGLHSGKDLPFGYPDEVALKAHASKVGDVAAKTPEVAEAIRAREELWAGLRQEAVDMGLLNEKVLDDPRYFHHQVLSHMRLKDPATTGSSGKDLRVGRKGYQKARIGSEKDYNTKYIESEFEVMSQIISQLETRKALNKIRRDADISTELEVEAKARGVSVGEIIPEGYTEWQPVKGNRFYQSLTIQDKFVDAFFAGERALKQGDFKEGVVVGGKKETWIIPERVAKTLDNFRDDSIPKGIEKWAMKANTAWKQWTLLNPTRFLKYSLNNMSGDFDIAFAYNPRIMSHLAEAHKLSREAVYSKGKLSEELDFMQKHGVVNNNFATHEIPDIGKSKLFAMIEGSNPNLLSGYWNKVKDFNSYRENLLRIAAYKFFKAEIDAGRTRYGASKPEMVDAIKDPKEKAAFLARELIGDYGNISNAGQYIRSRLMPFYSWMEINTKRYPALVRNLRAESLKELDTGGGVKRLALGTAARAGGKMAKHSAQIGALYAFVTLWNRTFFPDEEQDLGLSDRRQLHLILGRNKEGQVRSLRFQGALSDFLSWIGAEDFPQDIVDVGSGRSTLGDKFKEAAQAPVEKLINASMPMVKGAGEALTGKSLYPDPSNPRMIRDKAEHIASTFSLRTVYKYMAGHPTRGVASDIASLILYTSDPGEAAYYSSRTILYQWMKKNNVETPGGEPTRRSNALYYWRQAKKYGDEELAEKWMKRYEDLGGTADGIRKSIAAQHPMAPLPNRYQEDFDASLGAEEREIFRKAEEWYEQTYTGD